MCLINLDTAGKITYFISLPRRTA